MGRQLAGKLRLRVGLCLVLFKDESLCSDGNEPVESKTSVKGNFGPSAFLFLPGWFHFPSWFISLISQPDPMTGDFYYAFTNPTRRPFCSFFLPKPAIFFLLCNCWVANWLYYNSSMLTNLTWTCRAVQVFFSSFMVYFLANDQTVYSKFLKTLIQHLFNPHLLSKNHVPDTGAWHPNSTTPRPLSRRPLSHFPELIDVKFFNLPPYTPNFKRQTFHHYL